MLSLSWTSGRRLLISVSAGLVFGSVVRFGIPSLGWAVHIVSGWDAAGRQTLRIDARGNRTSSVFDGVNQLLNRKYPDGSRVTLAYDSTGNRNTMRDSTGRYTYAFDAVSRKTMVTLPSTQRLTYAFDAVGQRR